LETDSLIIDYLRFHYHEAWHSDESIIGENTTTNKLYIKLSQPSEQKIFIPFDVPTTHGGISRGVTDNKTLYLTAGGFWYWKSANDKVSLRASIQLYSVTRKWLFITT
jgi:hypothetical protein